MTSKLEISHLPDVCMDESEIRQLLLNRTGMGLVICYRIAERHNANITIDTGLDGTSFFVRLVMKVENYEKVYYCRRKNRSRKVVKNP